MTHTQRLRPTAELGAAIDGVRGVSILRLASATALHVVLTANGTPHHVGDHLAVRDGLIGGLLRGADSVVVGERGDDVAEWAAGRIETPAGLWGVLVLFGDAHGSPTHDVASTVTHLCAMAATALGDAAPGLGGETGVGALAALLDLRDGYTGTHSDDVVDLCCTLARRMGVAAAMLDPVVSAARLRDLGKIGVPDRILHKRGSLTAAERRVMCQHSAWGANALAPLPGFERVAEAVRGHHERWDGDGYPDGLAGQDIPLVSRIIAIADVITALTANRPYRASWSTESALDHVRERRGTQFDPDVVDALLELHPAPTGDAAPAPTDLPPDPQRRRGSAMQALPAALGRLGHLPALRESRDRVLTGLDEHQSAERVALAIESDIALTLAALRAANTKDGRDVLDVPAALSSLTDEELRSAIDVVPVVDFFQRASGWAVPSEHLRLHAVVTRNAAQRIAMVLDCQQRDVIQSSALLHDLGKLALERIHPQYLSDITQRALSPDDSVRAEQERYGIDHAAIGALALRGMGIPEPIARAVEWHHLAGCEDEPARVIRLADMVAHYLHADPIDPATLHHAARLAGLSGEQLRTVMFDLSNEPSPTRQMTPNPLSPQETEVLRRTAQGQLYGQIAEELGIRTSTVRSHCSQAIRRLGVPDRTQAVLHALHNGWL